MDKQNSKISAGDGPNEYLVASAYEELFDLLLQVEMFLLLKPGRAFDRVAPKMDEAYDKIHARAPIAAIHEAITDLLATHDPEARPTEPTTARETHSRYPMPQPMPSSAAGGKHDLNLRVGRAVFRLRKYRGLTQKALAARCGLTQAAVSQIEKGKRLSPLDVLQDIGMALGRPLNELIELALLENLENEIHLAEYEASMNEDPADEYVPWEQVKADLGL